MLTTNIAEKCNRSSVSGMEWNSHRRNVECHVLSADACILWETNPIFVPFLGIDIYLQVAEFQIYLYQSTLQCQHSDSPLNLVIEMNSFCII